MDTASGAGMLVNKNGGGELYETRTVDATIAGECLIETYL